MSGLGMRLGLQRFQKGTLLNLLPKIVAFNDNMVALLPQSILLQGDSTGNSWNEWVYLTTTYLSQKYLNHSVDYKLWDDTNQCYHLASRISTGSLGDAYADLPAIAVDNITCPDSAGLRITGDIEIIAKIAPATWTRQQTIVSKFGSAGNRGWQVFLTTDRKIAFWWSVDGTANVYVVSPVVVSFSDGDTAWIKVTFDVDNGAGGYTCKFFTSTTGATWTQLGTDVVGAAPTSIYASTANLILGSYLTGNVFIGKIYNVTVKQGIDGKTLLSPNLGRAFPTSIRTFKDIEGNSWTLNNNVSVHGSPQLLMCNSHVPGKAIAYSKDATRFTAQTALEPTLSFINFSHNEGVNVEYTDDYQGLIDMLLAKYANTGIVCTSQNPEKDTFVTYAEHAIRCAQIKALAVANNYMLINVFDNFINYGDWAADLMLELDDVHPNSDGQVRWANIVKSLFNRH